MKKILLSILMLVFIKANCQVEKGRNMIGGNAYANQAGADNKNLKTDPSYTSKANDFNVVINGGHFIKNSFMLGVFIGYGSNKNESKSNASAANGYFDGYSKNFGESYSGGLFARKYFMLYKDKLACVVNASLGYNSGYYNYYSSRSNIYSYSGTKNKGVTFGVSSGLVYFISRKFTLDATINLLTLNYTYKENYDSGTLANKSNQSNLYFNPNFNLSSIGLGFSYYFGKAKETNPVDKGTEK